MVLWRRSRLGSARDQILIAWDYDADLAVVHVPGCDVEQVLHSAKNTLEMLSITARSMATNIELAHVIPRWAPYKELYQQVRERPPQEGKTATSPHGSACAA